MSVLGKLLSDLVSGGKRAPRDDAAAPSGDDGSVFLYVGCGRDRGANVRHGFAAGWREIRLDIDPAVEPDIVGSLLDMAAIPDSSVGVVYSAHTLEHLCHHEVPQALAEMKRVLRPGGLAVLIVPDLQSVGRMLTEDRLFDTLYVSPVGAITAFDVLYGHRGFVAEANDFMAHRGGFTLTSLTATLKSAGFRAVAGVKRPHAFDFGVVACTHDLPDEQIRALVELHLPT